MTAAHPGDVYLVGAGPGDPELLTLKAARLLASADVLLHDDLIPAAVLAHAGNALVINVGKRCGRKNISQEQINAMMIDYARRGLSVVRLKSGDPLVFGRAGEEMDSLRAASVPFEVIPGITAASAAAAALRQPLTDRRSASSISFSAGQHAPGSELNPASVSASTRVVYMPGRNLSAVATQLRSEGLSADLPCVIVSRAAQPDQQIVRTTLGQLDRIAPVAAPSILLAGEVMRDSQTSNLDSIAPYLRESSANQPQAADL
ncbi:MAG TPA: uroporphyrinogen-III C-methyltransferase [Acidobacteriaceae bacterium]|nr:uroporphyrinogen-III C-methyltransferase [Acidobacteriaceae bacterium]